MGHRRVVITGMGGICALGSDSDTIWSSMKEGRDGCRPLSIITRDLKVGIGCGIVDYPEDDGIDKRQGLTMSGISRISVIAARQAMQQAGLEKGGFDAKRSGAVVGVGIFGTDAVDQSYVDVFVEHKKRTHIFTVPRVMPSGPSGHVSIAMGLEGPVFGVTSACASGNHAFISAVDQIRLGRADVMLARRRRTVAGLRPAQGLGIASGPGAIGVPSVLGRFVTGSCLATAPRSQCWNPTSMPGRAAPTSSPRSFGVGLSADASDIVNPTVEGPSSAMRQLPRRCGYFGGSG